MHMKMFSNLSLVLCAIALAFVGAAACKARTFDKSSLLKSAFLPAHYGNNSFFKNVEAKGKVVVDLYYLGNPPPLKVEIEQVKTVLTSHLQAWLSLMDDHPEWRLKSKEVLVEFGPVQFELPPNFKLNSTSSTGKESLKFIYTRDPEVFFSKVCSLYGESSSKPADRSLCYSAASPLDVIIMSGPLNRGHESTLKRQHWAILHEVGHLFGLGDVYDTSEVPEIEGRPTKFKSVMYGDSEELTDDDKLGLWAQYNFLKTGKRDCSGFGNRVTPSATTKTMICDPGYEPRLWIQAHTQELRDRSE